MPTKGECWLCHKRNYLTKYLLTLQNEDSHHLQIVMICSNCIDKLKKEEETHAE